MINDWSQWQDNQSRSSHKWPEKHTQIHNTKHDKYSQKKLSTQKATLTKVWDLNAIKILWHPSIHKWNTTIQKTLQHNQILLITTHRILQQNAILQPVYVYQVLWWIPPHVCSHLQTWMNPQCSAVCSMYMSCSGDHHLTPPLTQFKSNLIVASNWIIFKLECYCLSWQKKNQLFNETTGQFNNATHQGVKCTCINSMLTTLVHARMTSFPMKRIAAPWWLLCWCRWWAWADEGRRASGASKYIPVEPPNVVGGDSMSPLEVFNTTPRS